MLVTHISLLGSDFAQKVNLSIAKPRMELMLKTHIAIWGFIPLVSLFILFIGYKYAKVNKNILAIIVTSIIIWELHYFAQDMMPVRIMDWEPTVTTGISSIYDKKRVLEEERPFVNNQPLMFKAWTPYGDSQFLPNDYSDFYFQNKLGTKVRITNPSEYLRTDLNYENLKRLGFSAVKTKYQKTSLQTEDKVELLVENEKAKYLLKEEGHIIIQTTLAQDKDLHFAIKYDPNWIIKLNGKAIKTSPWESIFTQIHAPKGDAVFEFYYFPKDILLGLGVGLGFCGIGVFLYKRFIYERL